MSDAEKIGPINGRAVGTVWHIGSALLPDGWAKDVRIGVSAGRIVSVDAEAAAQPGDVAIPVAIPGMGNLHSHAFQRGMAGLTETRGPEGDSFWTWRSIMYRFVDRLTPDAMQAIAAFAYMEMLEAGFTRVGEFHYLHHDANGAAFADPAEMGARIAAAAQETGIGLTLLPVFYAHAGFGGTGPAPGQRRFVNNVVNYARLVEASRRAVAPLDEALVGIAPHSLRAVTPEELAAILPLAEGAPVHIHIAEQVKEVEECIGWSGARPVEWLFDHAPVDERWCLVHATHMTAEETGRLAASGAVAGLCPVTEANLGDGLFPARDYLAAGGRLGVGSDSNVRIDMAEELRLLEYGQRLHERARNVLAGGAGRSTGRTLFEGAVSGGAQALGVRGGLAVDAAADLVVLDPGHPATIGRSGDALLDSLIFGGATGAIGEIWKAGRKLVRQGRHERREEITARYRKAMSAVLGG